MEKHLVEVVLVRQVTPGRKQVPFLSRCLELQQQVQQSKTLLLEGRIILLRVEAAQLQAIEKLRQLRKGG